MNKTVGRGRRTLSAKFMSSLVALALVISIFVSISITGLYYHTRMKEYSNTAFSLARMASDYIDGDRVQGYVDTLEKDEYYERVQEFLDVIKKESDVWYYYVFVHDGDEQIYVWDAYSEDGMNQLGDREAYMEKGRGAVEEVLSENPPEDFIVAGQPEFGLIGTARTPVYDSAGKPVAVVGVDLNMPGVVRMMMLFLLIISELIQAQLKEFLFTGCAITVITVAFFFTAS